MKGLSVTCALVLGLMTGPAMAQAPTYGIDIDPTDAGKNFQPSIEIAPVATVTFDIHLHNVTAPQNTGCFWVDFTGSTADVSYVSAGRALNDGSEGGPDGPIGPWPPGGVLVNEPAGAGTIMGVMADLGAGAAPDGDGDLFLGRVTLQSTSAVDANVTISTIPMSGWSPIANGDVVNGDFLIEKDVECQIDADCPTNNYLWCDGWATCEAGICINHEEFPCNDADDCTLDICEEAAILGQTPNVGTCSNECAATGSVDPCCDHPVCDGAIICEADVTITVEPAWATPGDVGVKVDICLDNRDYEVGAFQVDICEEISGEPVDCLTCVGCEMTERTVLFDCFVYELEDGCCRVILISKHPGGVINPGICSIVKIDYTLCDPENPECPEECNSVDCIRLTPKNMIIADPYGNPLAPLGETGEVCPFECGDVDPGESAPDAKDCGDGDVDLVDIITEVNFALGSVTPDDCQFLRGDVPTGTPGYGNPPYCTSPDGVINVLDVMVLIDMALDRQDCCTYYYTGGIY